jgi:hypothetical protein
LIESKQKDFVFHGRMIRSLSISTSPMGRVTPDIHSCQVGANRLAFQIWNLVQIAIQTQIAVGSQAKMVERFNSKRWAAYYKAAGLIPFARVSLANLGADTTRGAKTENGILPPLARGPFAHCDAKIFPTFRTASIDVLSHPFSDSPRRETP